LTHLIPKSTTLRKAVLSQ